MAIYDLGTASLAANGEVTGVGTTWKAPLTLIRVGATIVFKTEPVQIYTISEIISDAKINVYNPNSETVPAGTGYAILAHDGITVQGLAQDVAETLRYYQSRETEVADAVDAFNNFDSADFESKVTQVNTQHGDVVSIGAQVSSDAAKVSADKEAASASAISASNDKDAAAISAQEAADYAASLDIQNLLRKDLAFSDLSDKHLARENLDVYSKSDVDGLIKYATPEDYLDQAESITDAIQMAFDESNYVDLSNRSYNITRTINVRDGSTILMKSTSITASLQPGEHLFSFQQAMQKGVQIDGGGGVINGTCESVFYFTGSTDDATQSSHYARNIRISNIYASSDNIRYLVYMGKAVRQVFMNNCYAYVRRGLRAYGKIVEIYVNNCIFFGSDSALDTDARLHVDAILPTRVPEGFHFTECLFDGPGKGGFVNDMYVMTVSGGYVGGDFVFGKPISLNHFISFTGCQCKGSIVFSPNSANDYRASIKPSLMHSRGEFGSVIINDGASGINVDTKFVGSSAPNNQGVAVVCRANCINVNLRIDVDNTYERACAFYGQGQRCSVEVVSYLGSSNPIYTERQLKIVNPLITSQSAMGQVSVFESIPQATHAVGSHMKSISISGVRGTYGFIRVHASISGLVAGTQRFTLSLPSGVSTISGSGWSALYYYASSAQVNMDWSIPVYFTTDSSGEVAIENSVGNPAVVSAHSWIGFFKS